jgi:hypothetical protein
MPTSYLSHQKKYVLAFKKMKYLDFLKERGGEVRRGEGRR